MRPSSNNAHTAECPLPLEIQQMLETIPKYLTRTDTNFQKWLQKLHIGMDSKSVPHPSRTLRAIIQILYKILILQSYEQLWTIYLKAGTGQLISNVDSSSLHSLHVSIWPKYIQDECGSNDSKRCHSWVNQQLQAIHKALKHWKETLNDKANTLSTYSFALQKQITNYLEQQMSKWHQQIDHRIALIHYDYRIHATKLAYLQCHPTPDQVRSAHSKKKKPTNNNQSFVSMPRKHG